MNTESSHSTTNIRIGRKGSLGLEGTIRNANHHAQPTLVLIKALAGLLPRVGFKEWVQYNNLHTFITHDGRAYDLRPLVYLKEDSTRSWGISVSCRVSRGKEIPLFDIKTLDDVAKAVQFFIATNQVSKNLYQVPSDSKEE